MTKQSLSVLSLNIEGDKHLDKVLPFLRSQSFDIICLQEVLNKDVPDLKKTVQMDGAYYPSVYFGKENNGGLTPGNLWGLLTLTNTPNATFFSHTYVGDALSIPQFDNDDFNRVNRVLAGVEYPTENGVIRVLSTHFTWTPDGKTNEQQRTEFEGLKTYLDSYREFVLCGDFNAPRGQEIWETLTQEYTDNIPQNITTTMDQNLHKVKGLELVVDGMFSTDTYKVENVQVTDGLSDHMAVHAQVSLK